MQSLACLISCATFVKHSQSMLYTVSTLASVLLRWGSLIYEICIKSFTATNLVLYNADNFLPLNCAHSQN